MSNVPHTVVRLAIAAAVVPAALLVPVTAALADSSVPSTKAQVEHGERLGASTPNKAQIEHAEQARTTVRPARPSHVAQSRTTSSGPEVWQLAASAAGGALVTGVAMVAGRRLVDHPRPLAS